MSADMHKMFCVLLSSTFQVEVNWENIQAKIDMEYQKERERSGGK